MELDVSLTNDRYRHGGEGEKKYLKLNLYKQLRQGNRFESTSFFDATNRGLASNSIF